MPCGGPHDSISPPPRHPTGIYIFCAAHESLWPVPHGFKKILCVGNAGVAVVNASYLFINTILTYVYTYDTKWTLLK